MRISDWSSDVCSSDLLTALAGKRGAHAERVEHPPARARHRRRATIETGRQHMIGIGGIDDDRRQTMRIERDAERTADQPAAQKIGRASCRERACQYV